LLGKMLVIATGFSKQLLERRLTRLVVASIFFQSGLNDIARNRLEPDTLGGGSGP